MPKGLPRVVKDNLEKCRNATIASVEVYNRPGLRFRTEQYLVMITIAWTALFHAIFYRRNRRPWYHKKTSTGVKSVRYIKIDGEPKHWELVECLKQYYGPNNPPQRKNLEFLIGLRNKIEHRHLPELDSALYGECQSALMNLEELIVKEFGQKYAMSEQLAVSLQFSSIIPEVKKKAARILASQEAKSVRDYVNRFRGGLPATVLNSMKYSFNVFLVPKVSNRENTADIAIDFIHVNEASPSELERLEKLNVLIREKHIPIANLDLFRPGQVVEELAKRVPFKVTMNTHTLAWKHFQVRPKSGARFPKRTRPEYCVYDDAHGDYLYTKAWIDKLVKLFSNPKSFKEITGTSAEPRSVDQGA